MPTPYRAEHVGSLLRPPELLQARGEYAQGEISLEVLRAVEDRAISAALEKQREIGIDILSDGEMRRGSWLTDVADAVEGFVPDKVLLDWKGPGGGSEGSTASVAGGKLSKVRKMTGHEVPFLETATEGHPFKVTLPAPSNFTLASYKKGVSEAFYPSHADLLRDLVDIVRDEIRWLVSREVRYIQLDAPYYSHYIDEHDRESMKQRGFDPDHEFEKAIEGDNLALREIPPGTVTRAFHVCRGNSRSRWYAEGGYDAIAEKLFGSLEADTFLLEYDTDRAGGFEPLRLVPKNKNVVLGLITTKDARLEAQEMLLTRIGEAAKYVPLQNLAVSPQCGFASVAAGNLLSVDDQWRKLELVVKTVRQVWR
jgi:5-methyltetrahydropteroyltriglutamate--homocysteine methyltransferase